MNNFGIPIGGFKAIGKSTLAKKYSKVIDLEIGDFEYIIDENLKKIPVEQRKGVKYRIKNPDYPLNYYNEIISNLKKNILCYLHQNQKLWNYYVKIILIIM